MGWWIKLVSWWDRNRAKVIAAAVAACGAAAGAKYIAPPHTQVHRAADAILGQCQAHGVPPPGSRP